MTNTVLAIDKHKLEEGAASWRDALESCRDLPCETPEHEAWWAEQMTKAQAVLAALEAEREALVRPLIDGKREVDEAFKAARTPAESFKALAKTKLAEAETQRLLAVEAARQLAADAALAGDSAGCAEALAAIPEASSVAGASATTVWVPIVEDAAKVPDIYKVVDVSLLKEAAKAFAKSPTPPTIPGVRFEREVKIAVRGGKKKS